jgi:hypothetical protein
LRISNNDFADAHYKKRLTVERNTIYKISAMVRYEGFVPNSVSSVGANISIDGEWTRSEGYTGSAWKKIELEFNSNNRTSVDILLRNGFYSADCKGTAWFSDVKIEKKDMTPSTGWNFLCLIIKNIDVTLPLPAPNGSNYRQNASYSQADVDALKTVLHRVPNRFRDISNSLMTVSVFDVYEINTPLTKITGRWGNGYSINAEDIQSILDPYLAQKQYDQIIVVAPLGPLATGWAGLGGVFYKNVGYTQMTLSPGDRYWHPTFPDAVFIHETLHCIESRAHSIKAVADLHAAESYGYNGKSEGSEWYTAYRRNTLPDGKGLPKEVYNVYRGSFTVISTNMEAKTVI